MKHTRILALVLALALCLTACGSTSSGSTSGTVEDYAAQIAEATTIPEEAMDDVVSYLTDGAYTADTVLATVGDTPITAAQVLYWVVYQQYNMAYTYYYYYGYTINMSDVMDEDGTTVGEYLLELGLETAIVYAVGAQKAAELGVELSEEDAAALETLYEDNVLLYGEDRWDTYLEAGLINEEDFTDEQKDAWIQAYGENFYWHSLIYYACTPEQYESIFSNFYYFYTLQDTLFADDGEYAPTDETMADYLADYISDNGIVWARCILFSTTDCEDDDAVAEVQAQAQSVYDELSALSGDELSEAFTEMQSAYDGSGYTAGEIEYFSSSDSLVDGYYDGITALEPGEIGMTEETDYGYFILLREEDQTDDIYDTVLSSYENTMFNTLLTQWQEEYDVTCTMDDLDLDAFYESLSELQQLLAAEDTITAAEDDTEDDTDAASSAVSS